MIIPLPRWCQCLSLLRASCGGPQDVLELIDPGDGSGHSQEGHSPLQSGHKAATWQSGRGSLSDEMHDAGFQAIVGAMIFISKFILLQRILK